MSTTDKPSTAGPPPPTGPPPVVTEAARQVQLIRSGANWFIWIAGLSLVSDGAVRNFDLSVTATTVDGGNVATAASNNPMLSTLTEALSGKLNPQVNLVDTLNNGEYTVFAPTNDAFAKLPASTINELKINADKLKSILTFHVVQGQSSPAKVDGMHKTLQGAEVNVSGQGNGLKVGDAGLVCGGVHTANATVYMIDTVLVPPSR